MSYWLTQPSLGLPDSVEDSDVVSIALDCEQMTTCSFHLAYDAGGEADITVEASNDGQHFIEVQSDSVFTGDDGLIIVMRNLPYRYIRLAVSHAAPAVPVQNLRVTFCGKL